jgi:hypothetical protein
MMANFYLHPSAVADSHGTAATMAGKFPEQSLQFSSCQFYTDLNTPDVSKDWQPLFEGNDYQTPNDNADNFDHIFAPLEVSKEAISPPTIDDQLDVPYFCNTMDSVDDILLQACCSPIENLDISFLEQYLCEGTDDSDDIVIVPASSFDSIADDNPPVSVPQQSNLSHIDAVNIDHSYCRVATQEDTIDTIQVYSLPEAPTPTPTLPLSNEPRSSVTVRRVRNNEASKRCRAKRKEKRVVNEAIRTQLEEENAKLKLQVKFLEDLVKEAKAKFLGTLQA